MLPESTPVLPSGHAHMNEHTNTRAWTWTHTGAHKVVRPSLCPNTIGMLISEDKRDGKCARPFNSAHFTHKGKYTAKLRYSAQIIKVHQLQFLKKIVMRDTIVMSIFDTR